MWRLHRVGCVIKSVDRFSPVARIAVRRVQSSAAAAVNPPPPDSPNPPNSASRFWRTEEALNEMAGGSKPKSAATRKRGGVSGGGGSTDRTNLAYDNNAWPDRKATKARGGAVPDAFSAKPANRLSTAATAPAERLAAVPNPPAGVTAAPAPVGTAAASNSGDADPTIPARLSISAIRRALKSGRGPVADKLRVILGSTAATQPNTTASASSARSDSRPAAPASLAELRGGSVGGFRGRAPASVVYVDFREELATLERQTESTMKKQTLRSAYGSLLVHSYNRLIANKRAIDSGAAAPVTAVVGDRKDGAAAGVDLTADMELVKRVWNSFVRRSTPTTAHHTMLMQSYAASGDLLGAEQTFRAVLQSRAADVDVFTFNALINIYVQHNQLTDADRILKELLARSFPKPDLFSFSPLIIAYAQQSGGVRPALQLFHDMKTVYGVKPNSVVYAAVMGAHAREANVAAVESLFAEMKNRRVSITRHTCNALIEAYGRAGDIDSAERVVWTDMPTKYGLSIGRSSIIALIEAIVRSSAFSRLVPLLESLSERIASAHAAAAARPAPPPAEALFSGRDRADTTSASRYRPASGEPAARWPDPIVYYALLRALADSKSSLALEIAFKVISHGLHSRELPPLVTRKVSTGVLDVRPYSGAAAVYPVLYTLTVQCLLLASKLDERQKRNAKLAAIKPNATASPLDPSIRPFADVQAHHASSLVLTDTLRKLFFLPKQLFIVTGKRRAPVHALGSVTASNALAATTAANASPASDSAAIDEGGMGDDDDDGDGAESETTDRSQRARDRELADTDVASQLPDFDGGASGEALGRPNRSVFGFVQDSTVLARTLQDALGRLRPRLTVLESRLNPGQFLIPHNHLNRHLRALWTSNHQLLAPLPSTAFANQSPSPMPPSAAAAPSAIGSGESKSASPLPPAAALPSRQPVEADDEDAVRDEQERMARIRRYAAPAASDLDPSARTSDGRPRDASDRDRRRRLERERHTDTRRAVAAINSDELRTVPAALRKRVSEKAKVVLAEPTKLHEPGSRQRGSGGHSVPASLLQSVQAKLQAVQNNDGAADDTTNADTNSSASDAAVGAVPSRRSRVRPQ